MERFSLRGAHLLNDAPDPRLRLAELVEEVGHPTRRRPKWFQGRRDPGDFFVLLHGDFLLVATPNTLRDGVVPAKPFIATTFLAHYVSDAELALMTGEELAVLLALTPEATRAWESACALRGRAGEVLRDAVHSRGRITREPPVWVRSRGRDISRF